jgi:hypothetical protein
LGVAVTVLPISPSYVNVVYGRDGEQRKKIEDELEASGRLGSIASMDTVYNVAKACSVEGKRVWGGMAVVNGVAGKIVGHYAVSSMSSINELEGDFKLLDRRCKMAGEAVSVLDKDACIMLQRTMLACQWSSLSVVLGIIYLWCLLII